LKKDFISIADLTTEDVWNLLRIAQKMKEKLRKGELYVPLIGRTLAMIFQKPSLRTRISFEVAMYQLGGIALYLSPNEIRIGERESVSDIAQVISRYCDGIMARLFSHEQMLDLARHASVPVINGLDDVLHPCQVMGDILTIWEHRHHIDNLKIAWIGDGNNVANSWITLASKIPLVLDLAVPQGYEPDTEILSQAMNAGISSIRVVHDPHEAVKYADVIYTDVWTSMGQESEEKERRKQLKDYQVNLHLVEMANDGVLIMHCLPAHRGEEITAEVIDGMHSIVFDQAENRLHIQKAIISTLMVQDVVL
jgi:ornithine carbamoyltransferase